MRLHTDLTIPDLYAALSAAKDAGLVAWHVFIDEVDERYQDDLSYFNVELSSHERPVTAAELDVFVTEVMDREDEKLTADTEV